MAFTSSELIDALRGRRRASVHSEHPAGEFPAPWKAWFASMHERIGAITGATAEAIVAVMFAREPASRPRASIALNRWGAFTTLWRQQWHPASEDERSTRIVAIVLTILVHLFLAVFLMYLAYVRAMGIPPDAAEGEEVIQVEFIGDGTPQDQGGGAAQDKTQPQPAQALPRTAPAAAAQPPRTAPQVAATPPAEATPSASVPTPPVDQPLQVTETPEPDTAFTLPPPRPVDVPSPDIPVPDLRAPSTEVRVVDIPAPVSAPTPRDMPAPAIRTPALSQRPAEVTIRDIPAPVAAVPMRDVPLHPSPAPDVPMPTAQVVERPIPAPPGPPVAAPTTAPSSAPSAASTSAPASNADRRAAPSSGTQPGPVASGAGSTPSPTPGALPSNRHGDDWGVSDRNRPGAQAGTLKGVFNADGTPRLVGGQVGGGLPPGTITEDFGKIDRNGTWLKRPPTDYTPTSFDRFWVPSETLLQEWVRKSIKEVLIPIPGTSKTIKCSVVVLALGGSCGISDPNLEDVEAGARKPPDVPFKPELQEDQGALKKK